MTTHHHFLAAILCDLGSTTPVLLLADWLEEEGDRSCAWWRELAAGMGAVRLTSVKRVAMIQGARSATLNIREGMVLGMNQFGDMLPTTNPALALGFVSRMYIATDLGTPLRSTTFTVLMDVYVFAENIGHREDWPGMRHAISATLPLSRLAAGVRQRLESHPDT